MLDEQTNNTAVARTVLRPALLVDCPGLRDYSTCLQHLFVGLAEMSYPAALICPPEARAGSVLCPSVDLYRYPMFKMPLLFAQNRKLLIDRLARFKPTVLHCFSQSKFRLTRHLARQLEIPYVLTFNTAPKRHHHPFVTDRYCSSLIASSKAIAQDISRVYRRFRRPVRQINIGTFVEDTCACFSAPNHIPSMIVAQRLENPSFFIPLLNAVRHLVIDGYEFMLVIIGTGPAERDIHRHIKKLGLASVVTLVGNIQPLRKVFYQADIFVQPQPARKYNSSLLEAMSVGMAVVTCRENKDDMVIEDETALVFDQLDEISVYSSLQKLLDKREFAKKIAIGAQTYLRKYHSVSRMTSALVDAYDSAQQTHKESNTTAVANS